MTNTPVQQSSTGWLEIRGASENNLRDLDVRIPLGRFVIVTGVSGSGKSSLVFDTIFGEAQRRLLHTISPYARRVIDQVGRPRMRSMTGLPPAVAVRQHRSIPGSRSTIGTTSTASDALRLLMSRAGTYPAGATPMDAEAFSARNHTGACLECEGTGRNYEVSESSLVPNPALTIREGAIAAWPGAWHGKNLRDILDTLGIDVDTPFEQLDAATREWILFTDDQPVVTVYPERDASTVQGEYEGTYMSARRYVLHTFATTKSASLKAKAERHLDVRPCAACSGTGLRAEALAVTFQDMRIIDLERLPLTDLSAILTEAARGQVEVEREVIADLQASLQPMLDLGLGHLALARPVGTLSGGELGRVRLARQISDGLVGLLYIFDEPSSFLHPSDIPALLALFTRLKDMGGSVLVVDHNPALMRAADWIVDLGPGAGNDGGRIVYSGPTNGFEKVEGSKTAAALHESAPVVDAPRIPTIWIDLGRSHPDSSDDDAETTRIPHLPLPLGVLTAITGPSGTGKSRILHDHIAPALNVVAQAPADRYIGRVVQLDQRPIGRTPRSVVGTYVGFFDDIRRLYAESPEARERNLGTSAFSFNHADGRCPGCNGEGSRAMDLHFLPAVRIPCAECHGRRYRSDVLDVQIDGRSIADLLDTAVADALEFFAGHPRILRGIRALERVGLSYLTLGHSAMDLSGGEAQRVRIATELHRPSGRHTTAYLLDSPGAGLHPSDVTLLLAAILGLVDRGDTVVIADHDLQLISAADWLIDVTSPPGARDVSVITGTRTELLASEHSATGPYLRDQFSNQHRPHDDIGRFAHIAPT